jgi:hypothetical protein
MVMNLPGCIKGGEFIGHLSDCQLLMDDSALWGSYLYDIML